LVLLHKQDTPQFCTRRLQRLSERKSKTEKCPFCRAIFLSHHHIIMMYHHDETPHIEAVYQLLVANLQQSCCYSNHIAIDFHNVIMIGECYEEEEIKPVDLTDLTEFNRQNARRRGGGGAVGIRSEKSTVEKTDEIIRRIMVSSSMNMYAIS
jgi:hypothetical protein